MSRRSKDKMSQERRLIMTRRAVLPVFWAMSLGIFSLCTTIFQRGSMTRGWRRVTERMDPPVPATKTGPISDHYLIFSMPGEPDENTGVTANYSPECNARLEALEKLYDKRREKRQKHVREARANSKSVYDFFLKKPRDMTPLKSFFDMWEPEAVCVTEERSGGGNRFDAYGDGPKFVCGVDYLRELYADNQKEQQQPCLVYSIGSNNLIDFEKSVKQDIGCEIHTFDPTLKSRFVGGAYASFHPWGLGIDGTTQTASRSTTFTAYSLDRIMKRLGHTDRRINILKIDCEGCEYDTMPPVFEAISEGKLKIDQILIEMHRRGSDYHPHFEAPTAFFEAADKAGFRITHKERNHWGCDGYKCVEYALVSNDYLRRATASVIC